MNNEHDKIEELLNQALEFKPEERVAFLAGACGEDHELRQKVETLLMSNDEASGFMENEDTLIEGVKLSEGPGTVIDRYKLLQQIGEGGMGVVYMAQQELPVKRKVALKIIKLGMDTKNVVARFEAERQALAMMDHPNIARVLDGGATETGRPYFVMELVRGVPITEYCDKNKLSTQERLELFIPVCQGIQHAHQKGIIHRDIKPSNVMVTLHDGDPVPKVIDFGIAKATNQKLTEKTLFTNYAQMIGTPAYMSPEQAEMSGLDVDTRADVYSLGVLFYELLTGTTPFPTKELMSMGYGEMQRIIAEREPLKPSTRLSTMQSDDRTVLAANRSMEVSALGKVAVGDLDWIVMKSLEKDRTHRYETVNALVADIRRHLNDEPVSVAAPTFSYQFHKFARRNKKYMKAAAAVALMLVMAAVFSTIQAIRANNMRRVAVQSQHDAQEAQFAEVEQRKEAVAAKLDAQQKSQQARLNLYAADMNLAQVAIKANNFGRAERLLNHHIPTEGEDDLRHWEWRYLWQQIQGDELYSLPTFDHHVYNIDHSPDGRHLAVSLYDGRILIWDLQRHQQLKELTPKSGIIAKCLYSTDGKMLIGFNGAGRGIRRWDTRTFREESTLTPPDSLAIEHARHITVSRDGRYVATFASCRETTTKRTAPWVIVWNLRSGIALWAEPAVYSDGYLRSKGAVCFSADGSKLFVGELDGKISRRDSATGATETNWLADEGQAITALAASPDGRVLASGCGYGLRPIQLWSAETGELIKSLLGHERWISWLEFSSDGKILASASADQTARIWDMEMLTTRSVLKGHRDELYTLSLGPDASELVTGSKSGVISVWNTHPMERPKQYIRRAISREHYSYSQNGARLFISDEKRGVLELDSLDLSDVGNVDNITASKLIVAGRRRLENMYRIRSASGIPDRYLGLSYAPHANRLLALNHGSNEVVVLNPDSWDVVATLPSQNGIVNGGISADGNWIALGGVSGKCSIFNISSGKFVPVDKFDAHKDELSGLEFSQDGRLLATTSLTGNGSFWRTDDWTRLESLRGHAMAIHDVAFSSDSRRLFTSGNDDDAIKLWDTTSYQEVLTLNASGNLFNNPTLLDDGCTLVATSSNNGKPVLHVWHAPTWEEIAVSATAALKPKLNR